MRRLISSVSLVLLFSAFVAPAPGYAQQSLNVYLGGFVPRGEDARVKGDVLFNDLTFFDFNLESFRGGTVGADWLFAVTNNVEAGLGLGIYSREVRSRYAFLVNTNRSDITQRLKLRMAPFTATFRVLPFGRSAPVQPYLGGGVAAVAWRYTETGDFVDFSNNVFHDRFEGSGTATGPVILGGLRFPVGSGDFGFEIRHQSGEGNVNSADFAGGSKIDLGGTSYLATFNIRF